MRVPNPLVLTLGLSLAATGASAQAAASSPAAAATASTWGDKPAGTFNLVADVNGDTRTATLALSTDSTGTSRARVVLDDGSTHDMAVKVAGADLVLTEPSPEGDMMTFKLQLRADSLSGNWTKGLNGGTLKGARTP